jgi:SAM-dependent methyltransferase
MNQLANIHEIFQTRREEDVKAGAAKGDGLIQDWMLNWHYQDQKEDVPYGEDQPHHFDDYEGPGQICDWIRWTNETPTDFYLPSELIDPFSEKSQMLDQRIFEKAGIDFDFSQYRAAGRSNAQDYVLQNLYPVPERCAISSVLDFGAGYGRHANLWSQHNNGNVTMVGMDAVPQSYCLQNFYYGANDLEFTDYLTTDEFLISADKPGIYHCPTWRWDLLPSNFFDMVICCQVLPELSPELAKFAVQLFFSVLKPGGALYIRDHDQHFNPSGIDLNGYIQERGFVLEFRPHVIDRVEIHGIPRIWRKPDQRVVAAVHP